jgi:hypothetical protein
LRAGEGVWPSLERKVALREVEETIVKFHMLRIADQRTLQLTQHFRSKLILMEVPNHEDKVRLFICFDESSPELIVNPECIKPFVCAFERFEVEGWMEGIGKK